MCLSTVYVDSDTGKEVFMRDVAEMEAEGDGFFSSPFLEKGDSLRAV